MHDGAPPAVTNLVALSATVNAGITILPTRTDDVQYIVTLSEDGSTHWIWRVLFCSHPRHTNYGGHDPTCDRYGDTGVDVCDVCGKLITPTEPIPPLGHDWDAWVTNKPPSEAEMGLRSHTCQRCGYVGEDKIPALPGSVPVMLAQTAVAGDDGWMITGIIRDYQQPGYYVPNQFGFVIYEKVALGERTLTVNTSGRTKVTFDIRNVTITRHEDEKGVEHVCGDYVYNLLRSQPIGTYVIRAWMRYNDNEGIPRYGYGEPIELKNNQGGN